MTLVSIVIPCFNAGRYVLEAVASARTQTWPAIDSIVVDDGSDDEETRAALADVEASGVTVVRIAHGGPSVARNAGIERARGGYVFTLDADDSIAPTLIERAVPLMEADETVGIVYSDTELFGAKTGVWALPPYRFPDILLGNVIPSAALFRREDWAATGGYRANMVDGWEDWDFWLSLIGLGRRVVRIPEPLLRYRRHDRSRSTDLPREAVIRAYAQLFRNHQQMFVDHIETVIAHIYDLRRQAVTPREPAAPASRSGARSSGRRSAGRRR